MAPYVICARIVRALRGTGYAQLAFCPALGQERAREDWVRVVETI